MNPLAGKLMSTHNLKSLALCTPSGIGFEVRNVRVLRTPTDTHIGAFLGASLEADTHEPTPR